MWMCNDCGEGADPDGFRNIVAGAEKHLLANAECHSAMYTYGGQKADRTAVYINKDETGKLSHKLRERSGWDDERSCEA